MPTKNDSRNDLETQYKHALENHHERVLSVINENDPYGIVFTDLTGRDYCKDREILPKPPRLLTVPIVDFDGFLRQVNFFAFSELGDIDTQRRELRNPQILGQFGALYPQSLIRTDYLPNLFIYPPESPVIKAYCAVAEAEIQRKGGLQ